MAAGEVHRAVPVRDEAVQGRTGRGWSDWFARLDAAGAPGWDHAGIVAHLEGEVLDAGASAWWAPLIAAAYEQARGRRPADPANGTHQVRKGRTLNTLPGALYDAWIDPDLRARWLGPEGRDAVVLRGSLEKGLRLAWPDDLGQLDVQVLAKGFGKTQVSVQHAGLPDPDTAAAFLEFWARALDRLRALLEA